MAAKLTELGRTTESHTVADEDLEEAHGAAADACCLLAKAALVVGHLPDAERWIGEAFELAHTHGIVDLPHVGYYYVMVGALHARRGEFAPADHAIGLGLEQMQGQADSLLIADALLERALIARAVGARTEARAMLADARAAIENCPDPGTLTQRVRRGTKTDNGKSADQGQRAHRT